MGYVEQVRFATALREAVAQKTAQLIVGSCIFNNMCRCVSSYTGGTFPHCSTSRWSGNPVALLVPRLSSGCFLVCAERYPQSNGDSVRVADLQRSASPACWPDRREGTPWWPPPPHCHRMFDSPAKYSVPTAEVFVALHWKKARSNKSAAGYTGGCLAGNVSAMRLRRSGSTWRRSWRSWSWTRSAAPSSGTRARAASPWSSANAFPLVCHTDTACSS